MVPRHRQAGGGNCQTVYRLPSRHPGDPHRAAADDRVATRTVGVTVCRLLRPALIRRISTFEMTYSRFPVVEVLSSTAADVAIRAFDRTFALMGGITDLKTDNESPFQSQQIVDFVKSLGFTHHKITLLFPSANCFGEKFMRCLNKALQAVHIVHKNWRLQLVNFFEHTE